MASSTRDNLPPWHHHLTLDLLLYIGSYTIFHPFVAWMLPLSLRAMAADFRSTSFRVTFFYACFVFLWYLLSLANQRLAYGPPRKVSLLDEVVVITGGAKGLGRCLAEIYAMKGVGVAILDVDVKEEGEREGIRSYRCDVGDRKMVEDVWKRIDNDLGPPTVLVNNAAVVNGNPFTKLSLDDVERTFRVNTIAHYHLTSLFLAKALNRRNGGTLVTISSVLGRLGAANLSAYTASKAAAIAFHTSLSAELSSHPNIKTILVTPGQLDTALFGHIKLDWFRNFFGPVVEVRELAVKMVKLIDAGEGGTIAVPTYAGLIPWLETLPKALQNSLKRWSGVDAGIVAPSAISGAGQQIQADGGEEKKVLGKSEGSSSDSEYSVGG